jgi:hypothetical protein
MRLEVLSDGACALGRSHRNDSGPEVVDLEVRADWK